MFWSIIFFIDFEFQKINFNNVVLNAERASMEAPAFKPKLLRTRKILLEDMANLDYKAAEKNRKSKSANDVLKTPNSSLRGSMLGSDQG